MQLQGKLITVGDMAAENVQPCIGVPAVQIRAANGRIITISGLTHDEAREAAKHFGEQIHITLVAAAG